jgi:hypothetical protein
MIFGLAIWSHLTHMSLPDPASPFTDRPAPLASLPFLPYLTITIISV